ncbi:uncharacterized protein LOC119576673 [Penaeus monodon]|uniref:uncharacterized protein LOC119576673 n=1 Tax=Penaeus monodon TaxID=6687 RepID=UPI0018A7305E|nr:uncharacterized protein LOC119576673 [Penaeus monodon]
MAEHNHHYQCGTVSFGEEIGPTNHICAFCNTHGMTTEINLIPDRSGPGIKTAALSFGPSREGSVKYATGDETSERNVTKVETVIGIWNVRSLNQCGKAELLVHEMDNLNWHILGISEMRWEGTGEALSEDGHKLWFSGNNKKKINGVGFLVNKAIKNSVLEYTNCCDEVIDDFYENLNDLIKTIPRKDILVVQGDWNAKIGEDAYKIEKKKLKDPTIAEQYRGELAGRFAPLLLIDQDPQTHCDEITNTIRNVAEEKLGKCRKIKRPWLTSEVLEKCEDRRNKKKRKCLGAVELAEYRNANRQTRNALNEAKNKWLQGQTKDIEESLHRNNTKEDLPLEEHILLSEVEWAIKELKRNKSPGADNICAELIQVNGDTTAKVIHKLCSEILKTKEWPSQWTESVLITIPKKANNRKCSGYRTISLISHTSKVLLKIIKKRISPRVEEVLSESQAGFRRGRSTVEQITTIKILNEKMRDTGKLIFHNFIDFRKAFDKSLA